MYKYNKKKEDISLHQKIGLENVTNNTIDTRKCPFTLSVLDNNNNQIRSDSNLK